MHYTAGAPSTSNLTAREYTATSSGANKITINSTYFSTYIPSATCEAKCTNYTTDTQSISAVGTYRLTYVGTTIPRKGVNITVKMELKNHNISRSVAANGTITP